VGTAVEPTEGVAMEVSSHRPGTPSWVDVTGPDVEVLAGFYSSLFGWDAEDQGEEAGHYTMFSRGGRSVAAASPSQPGADTPPAWTTYVTVADADAAAATIADAGGMVMAPPFDVFDSGRMALAADPTGGVFAVWQPGEHIGAEVVNEPVSLCWNELTVRHAETALAFYGRVFGWEVNLAGGDDAPFIYRELVLGDRAVAGCMEMDETWPEAIPTHWMTYFAVEDTDATARRAAELGGTVSVEPFDLPTGRTAVLNDPAGAVFSVITLEGRQ
jgi:predicted enzyme related to lactoylglutathione lyase